MNFNPSAFINEVRKRPVLWDSRNKVVNSVERIEVWNELCELYSNVEDIQYSDQNELSLILQKKWKNIRDSYVKFLKRAQANPYIKINFRLAKQLSFLDKVIPLTAGRNPSKIKKEGEGEGNEEEEMEEIQNTRKKPKRRRREKVANDGVDNAIEGPEEIYVDENYNGETSIDFILDQNMDESQSLKTSNSNDGFDLFMGNQNGDMNCFFDQSHVKNSRAQERDECTVYGELVGVKLRKLSPRTRTYVQHLINNTLFKAEMGKYDNSTDNFGSSSVENDQYIIDHQ